MRTWLMKRATLLALGLAARATALQIPFRAAPRPVVDPCESEPLGIALNFNTLVVDSLKGMIDKAYTGRDIPRFFVLESLARVPYFSYLSCLHLYESLGMRGNARLMRLHYAEVTEQTRTQTPGQKAASRPARKGRLHMRPDAPPPL